MLIFLFKCKKPFHNSAFIFMLTILSISLIFACSTNKKVKKTPEFRVVKTTLTKGINETGDQDILLSPTDTFTTKDNAVIAHVEFANISGKHKVQWKWYEPDGNLYYMTKAYKVGVSKKQYVDEASAWHKISIQGDKAQKYPGDWKVEIYYDGDLISSLDFKIQPAAYDTTINVDNNIPRTAMNNPNGIAVLIGNSNYHHRDIPNVEYALNDAEVMKRYVIQTLGYKEGNILFVTDATKAKFEALFGIHGEHRGLLHDYIKPNVSEIFIYYSGHGAPDTEKMKGYFVPVDCDPAKVSLNGYPLDLFYENLSKIKARKTTVVLDTCFSGGTNTGRYLIGGASPALIRINTAPVVRMDAAILTSSDSDQISSWYEEKNHGLFTYFFLLGLRGSADQNNDSQVTYQELHDFVSNRTEGVPYWSRRLHGGRTQIPMLYGNRNQDVIVQF